MNDGQEEKNLYNTFLTTARTKARHLGGSVLKRLTQQKLDGDGRGREYDSGQLALSHGFSRKRAINVISVRKSLSPRERCDWWEGARRSQMGPGSWHDIDALLNVTYPRKLRLRFLIRLLYGVLAGNPALLYFPVQSETQARFCLLLQ
ncbi:hypothetical protein J6590_020824 [Homalodisca vitripennis]|nr:hypothetical protein J6590_020824 [Homalodisca vitripennis]